MIALTFLKARVRQHQRGSKKGKRSTVKQHERHSPPMEPDYDMGYRERFKRQLADDQKRMDQETAAHNKKVAARWKQQQDERRKQKRPSIERMIDDLVEAAIDHNESRSDLRDIFLNGVRGYNEMSGDELYDEWKGLDLE